MPGEQLATHPTFREQTERRHARQAVRHLR
jgi:hypothetical protein